MEQTGLFQDEETAKGLLADLLEKSRLYHQSKEFLELLVFISKLRNVAPFNAMLLHIQKPGIQYVASQYDWLNRFNRKIKADSRPLLILYPFGPVAFVYDVEDTDGELLPEIVTNPFPAVGQLQGESIDWFINRLARKKVFVIGVNSGAGLAGKIKAERTKLPPVPGSTASKESVSYTLTINSNHDPNQQCVTIAHELAHLFLGHLGTDEKLQVKTRRGLPLEKVEIEAESVAYLVCMRHGIKAESQKYLSAYTGGNTPEGFPDLYAVMKAAGQVENLLGIGPEVMRFGE